MARHVALVAPALAALLFIGAPLAEAGNLGKVGKAVSRQQNRSSGGGGSSGTSDRPPREPTRDRRATEQYADGYYAGRGSYYYTTYRAPCDGCAPVAIQQRRRFKPELHFKATYENVRDSDGSINLDSRVVSGPFGFGFSVSSYFEGAQHVEGNVRMTMWEGNIGGQVLQLGADTELWLTLGVNGLQSNQFDNTIGGGVGAEMRHQIRSGLAIDARARGMMYPDDINATELRAGVTASVLHIGYRRLKFNVGPALEGPELGISLRF